MIEQPDLFAPGVAEAGASAPVAAAASTVDLERRFADFGVDALDEGDVIALVLARCLPAGADTVAAADALVARFGDAARVLGAAEADVARVIGPSGARRVALLHALLVRTLALPLRQRAVLSSTTAVLAYLRARLAALPREAFHVLFLDRKNQLIADECLGRGTIDHAPVYPREVVRRALELSASALLLAHNHPSGDPTPSSADVAMTTEVVEAARALRITVHDHFVVGGDLVVSLRALGLM
jgi:DNA repair protein RadC